MKDYKLLLQQNAYDLNLEEFKSIPFPECEKYPDFLGYLCYYQKTDIVIYCLEHSKYKSLIDSKKMLDDYCLYITLDKGNLKLLDYFLKNKHFTKNDIINSISGFFTGNVDFKYLPEITQDNVGIVGNQAIYHVKPEALELALRKGFNTSLVDVESVFFCFKNHVDEEDKQRVLEMLQEKLDISDMLIKDSEKFLKGLEEVNSHHQCFEEVVKILFMPTTIDKMIKNHFWIMMKMVKEEAQSKSNYLKNTILLEYPDNFSIEDLQKIKKFHKDFYREIEKVKLYSKLQDKPESFNVLEKRKKI